MFDKINRRFVEKNLPDEIKGKLMEVSESVMQLVAINTTLTKNAILNSGKRNEDGSITIPKEVVDILTRTR